MSKFFLVLFALAILAVPASAQSVTPSDVYQVVEDVNGELALFHEANGSKPKKDKKAPALTNRRPRHVIQKAREVLLKVQALRKLNGLPENSVPAFPVREVKPADVKKIVEHVRTDVRELRGKFNVTKPSPASAKPSGKTPTDVYQNLTRASLQMDGLGIPRIVPNDVYRLAMTIIGDLELIRAKRGISGKVAMQTGAKSKKPKHVFHHGFKAMQALEKITTEMPDYAVPGGVVMPNMRKGKIRPEHVMDLLNKLLAEIAAVKVKVGATTPTVLAAAPSGKTPSNVYDAISTALELIETLPNAAQG
jgi:hypothetical protein